ncbi:hypothetical protein EJ06DRAFT_411151 [Trichodelitschia bisporula]|uniref:Uncharacterized protein n=1 Tax=Trichodelitschia bisporula TaxID=703511 RepID=A0A6G1HYD3_9PEZI|nr:hypothetical protein EJ06DRAFT_411151 [Trichodelitschia bisporula]
MSDSLSAQLRELYDCFATALSPIPCYKLLQGQKLSDYKLEAEEVFMTLSDFFTEFKDRPEVTSRDISRFTECVKSSEDLYTFLGGLDKRGLCTSFEAEELSTIHFDFRWSLRHLRRIARTTRKVSGGHVLQITAEPGLPFRERLRGTSGNACSRLLDWLASSPPGPRAMRKVRGAPQGSQGCFWLSRRGSDSMQEAEGRDTGWMLLMTWSSEVPYACARTYCT